MAGKDEEKKEKKVEKEKEKEKKGDKEKKSSSGEKKKHRSRREKKDGDGKEEKKKSSSSSSSKHRSSKSSSSKKSSSSSKKDGESKHRSSKSSTSRRKHSSHKKDRKEKEEKAKPTMDELSVSDDEAPKITVFKEKYDIGEELGRGAFSVVYKCVSKRSKRNYAVKVIEKKDVGQDMSRLRTEIDILTRVKHPNIINLKEIMEDDKTLYIITEMVTGGELFDKIVELGAYTEADAAKLVQKMVSAIDYLHDQGIVHRDLKPENLLLKNADDISEVKLADFGLSKIVATGPAAALMQTACGTPGYVAPEVLTADGYDKEVDLWSIGVITYILLCGFPPFYNEHLPQLFEQIMHADFDYPPDYWDEISDTAKDFINRLLVVDPQNRMTTKQALEHPWLRGQAPDKKLGKVNEKMATYVQQYRTASRENLKQ